MTGGTIGAAKLGSGEVGLGSPGELVELLLLLVSVVVVVVVVLDSDVVAFTLTPVFEASAEAFTLVVVTDASGPMLELKPSCSTTVTFVTVFFFVLLDGSVVVTVAVAVEDSLLLEVGEDGNAADADEAVEAVDDDDDVDAADDAEGDDGADDDDEDDDELLVGDPCWSANPNKTEFNWPIGITRPSVLASSSRSLKSSVERFRRLAGAPSSIISSMVSY